MFKRETVKHISILIVVTLIISMMSAFVLPKNTKADEVETTAEQETQIILRGRYYEAHKQDR